MVNIKIAGADNISTVNTLKRIARKTAKIILTKHRFQHKILQKKAMQKDAEENTHAWANVAMISCVADLHESKAKCATNKH